MQKVKSGKTCWSYENSQSIKQKSSESTSKPYGGDISLGNNANEAIYISDDLSREKEMRLPPIYSVYHQRHQHKKVTARLTILTILSMVKQVGSEDFMNILMIRISLEFLLRLDCCSKSSKRFSRHNKDLTSAF